MGYFVLYTGVACVPLGMYWVYREQMESVEKVFFFFFLLEFRAYCELFFEVLVCTAAPLLLFIVPNTHTPLYLYTSSVLQV